MAALVTWSCLYRVVMDGRSCPPFSLDKNRHLGSAGKARPHHLLRNFVARGCNCHSMQERGKLLTERSQVIRGQIANLNNLSFCCRVTRL